MNHRESFVNRSFKAVTNLGFSAIDYWDKKQLPRVTALAGAAALGFCGYRLTSETAKRMNQASDEIWGFDNWVDNFNVDQTLPPQLASREFLRIANNDYTCGKNKWMETCNQNNSIDDQVGHWHDSEVTAQLLNFLLYQRNVDQKKLHEIGSDSRTAAAWGFDHERRNLASQMLSGDFLDLYRTVPDTYFTPAWLEMSQIEVPDWIENRLNALIKLQQCIDDVATSKLDLENHRETEATKNRVSARTFLQQKIDETTHTLNLGVAGRSEPQPSWKQEIKSALFRFTATFASNIEATLLRRIAQD